MVADLWNGFWRRPPALTFEDSKSIKDGGWASTQRRNTFKSISKNQTTCQSWTPTRLFCFPTLIIWLTFTSTSNITRATASFWSVPSTTNVTVIPSPIICLNLRQENSGDLLLAMILDNRGKISSQSTLEFNFCVKREKIKIY